MEDEEGGGTGDRDSTRDLCHETGACTTGKCDPRVRREYLGESATEETPQFCEGARRT